MKGVLFAALLVSTPAWAGDGQIGDGQIGDGQSLITEMPSGANALVSGPNYSIPPSLPDVLEESVQLADSICGKLPSVTTDGVLPSVREEMDRIRTCRTDIVTKYLERRPKQ